MAHLNLQATTAIEQVAVDGRFSFVAELRVSCAVCGCAFAIERPNGEFAQAARFELRPIYVREEHEP